MALWWSRSNWSNAPARPGFVRAHHTIAVAHAPKRHDQAEDVPDVVDVVGSELCGGLISVAAAI
jgi:hypothetical protein